MSSIVRRLYYDKYNRVALLPRVVVGTPDSWDQSVSISRDDRGYYGSCTWSPCGQFIAALTRNAVKILNQLTLEQYTTLQPTEPVHRLKGPLAYSPDGHSLACTSSTAIVVWDIQTGGVTREITCNTRATSMAWSLDGRAFATVSKEAESQWSVHTYQTPLGVGLFIGTLESDHCPCLWA